LRHCYAGARKFSDTVKTELSEELRIHELHANLKKAEQSDMTNLSPEVADSVKSLQDAADMVNEPFKKVDRSALDSMISSSLETQSSQTASSRAESVEHSPQEKIDSPSQEKQQEPKL
jgi:sec-independent protein translocase protein TatB